MGEGLRGEHTSTAVSYNNIAEVIEVKRDLDGALTLSHESLTVDEKVYMMKHTNTATSYNNIASVMKEKGDLDGALTMYHTAFAL